MSAEVSHKANGSLGGGDLLVQGFAALRGVAEDLLRGGRRQELAHGGDAYGHGIEVRIGGLGCTVRE